MNMSARQEANAAAAKKTEQLFKAYLAGLSASHAHIDVTRTEDVLRGKIEIKISATAKIKQVAA